MRLEDEPPLEDLSGTVVRGVGLAGGGYILAQALNLGFYLALARLATPSEFGQLAAGSIIVGAGLLISESGMMAAVVQRRNRAEEAASTALFATVASGFGFSLVALALSPLIGLFFDSAEVGKVAAAMSGIIFIRTLSAIPDAVLQRRFSFLRRMVVEPASVIAFGIAAVIATANDMGVWGLVIGQYAAAVTDLTLSWTLARWRPRPGMASFAMWRELIAYGRHVFAATLILRVGEQADALWLGRFLGTASLGQYRYAFRLASTPYLALVAGASYVLFPAFSRIATEAERFKAAFMRSLRWMCVVGFPACLVLLPLGVPMAVILFGEVWREAGYAAMAMCLYGAAGVLSSIASEALKAHGRPDLLTRMHTLTTVLTAILMGALLPVGIVGVAAALSLGATVSAIYAIRLLHRTIGFELDAMWREIWPPAAAALAMVAIMLPVEHLLIEAADAELPASALLLAGELLAAAAVYLLALRLIAPHITRELLHAAARLLVRFRRRRRGGDAAEEVLP
ncbi:MAG: lipopolysaccharide biosynthesis protein [Solirubrobacterales bacterium]